jgi:hypothetical protein
MIKLTQTSRGLLIGEFEDRYGKKCSVQESSLATESCIWLGVDVNADGQDVEHGRMHLTQVQAAELIPFLRYFARNGTLGYDDPKERFRVGVWVRGLGATNDGIEGRIIEVVPNDHVVVQDNLQQGERGQILTLWNRVDLVWDVMPPPENVPSRYDILQSEEDDGLG